MDLKLLNPEQKKAVTHGEGPLLIVAGAGTGKTTVITQRLAWLIEQKKAKGNEILVLTFTDKAAGEMEERLDRLLPYGYLDLWVSTFHGFGQRILEQHALEVGLPNNFKLLSQTQQWMLIRQNFDRFNLDYYRPLGHPTKFISALVKHFSRCKDEDISPQEYLKYAEDLKLNSDSAEFIQNLLDEETRKQFTKKELKEVATQEIKKINELAGAYHVYQQLLLENSALDFGDLIIHCLKLFRERPAILARYRMQFKYVLVDEFQDTNWAQYEMVKLLAASKNNITVVGDDDQSIYKFRGASVSNILEFKKDYPKSEEVVLTKNYRSAQNILDLSYEFIKQNDPNRLEYKLSNFDKSAKSKKGKLESKISKELKAQKDLKGEIEHLHAETGDDEVKLVIEKIAALKKLDKEISWNDFAVLVRANEAANPFISGFASFGVPHQFVSSRGLYTKTVVLDIINYLKLLDNYHESSAMYRIMSMPIFSFDHRQIINLNYWAKRKNWSLYETFQRTSGIPNVSAETLASVRKLLSLIEKHSALTVEKNVSEIVYGFLEDSGYLKYLTGTDNIQYRQQVSFLNQFYKKIKEFEQASDDKSVKAFLASIELEIESGDLGSLTPNLDEGPEAVKIMTVHAAKGLEFKYVFVANLVDRRFPTTERRDPIELPDTLVKEIIPEGDIHLEEERRLFYVAMTRAKSGLYLTSAEDYGGATKKKLSRFLTELGAFGLKLAPGAKSRIKSSAEIEIAKDSDISFAIPKKFSFSQLRAYESCPWQYRYAFVLSIPIKGKSVFSFGQTIHSTLQRFFQAVIDRTSVHQRDLFGDKVESKKNRTVKAKDVISLDELLKIYEESWIDDWYESKKQKEEYRKKGIELLKNLYKGWEKSLPVPRSLEEWFNLKLSDDGEVYTLAGRIDRIDEGKDGKIEIIDYKTGSAKYEEKMKAEDKDQLLIYQLAAREVFGDKISGLTFHYVEDDHKVTFLGDEKELEKTRAKAVKLIKEIKKGQFTPKPGPLCKFCDFKDICEFRAY